MDGFLGTDKVGKANVGHARPAAKSKCGKNPGKRAPGSRRGAVAAGCPGSAAGDHVPGAPHAFVLRHLFPGFLFACGKHHFDEPADQDVGVGLPLRLA